MIETRKTLFISSETWEKLFGKSIEKSCIIEMRVHPIVQADEMVLLSDVDVTENWFDYIFGHELKSGGRNE